MPFFDFHVHPTLKSLFSEDNPALNFTKLSPWEKIKYRKIPFLIALCTEFPYILQSQACLAQLQYNECNLVCVALYIPERDIIDNSLIKGQAKGKLKGYLQERKISKILNSNPFHLLIEDDLNTLTSTARFGQPAGTVKPLSKRDDYNENDTSTIHVVFSVEGCHTLSDGLRTFNAEEILKNLDELRGKVAVLSLNITHIEQSPLCNHAFAILFINKESFYPKGLRIGEDGITIIKHCYQNNIIIDVKHMSLAARMHLYSLRKENDWKTFNQPLVCTHAGFTGIPSGDITKYIIAFEQTKKGYVKITYAKPVRYGNIRPSFNPSSINLYDDEIISILESGGMIGLSLDKRILGFLDYEANHKELQVPVEIEFVSDKEINFFLPNKQIEVGTAIEEGKTIQWDEVKEGGLLGIDRDDYHLKHFMAHVLHLVVVAENNGYDVKKALTQVCIGSDFDGLINPINVCDTVDELVYFKRDFIKTFPRYAKESKVNLPTDFKVDEFAEALFFENGRDFVLRRLDVMNGE